MERFGGQTPNGLAVQELETLVRTAIFKPANALVGWLLQQAANRIDAAYQPAPGRQRKGREPLRGDGLFGTPSCGRTPCVGAWALRGKSCS
jgi:hypothetical protein